MDQDPRMAMRMRADEAMTAALAAGEASTLASLIHETIASIKLVCEDETLVPRDKLVLLDDALLLLASVKKLVKGAQAPPPEAVMEVLRRTNGLLRRYTRLVR